MWHNVDGFKNLMWFYQDKLLWPLQVFWAWKCLFHKAFSFSNKYINLTKFLQSNKQNRQISNGSFFLWSRDENDLEILKWKTVRIGKLNRRTYKTVNFYTKLWNIYKYNSFLRQYFNRLSPDLGLGSFCLSKTRLFVVLVNIIKTHKSLNIEIRLYLAVY